MRRERYSPLLVGIGLSVIACTGLVGLAADESSVIDARLLGVAVDAGAYESGSTLGLEIVGDGAGRLIVERVALLGGDTVFREDILGPATAADRWIGAVPLIGSAGDPLPPGEYAVAVFTTDGAFLATFTIARPSELVGAAHPIFVSFSGPTLHVYRLLTDRDTGSEITIQNGGSLMIALTGNATTGFAWSDVTENQFPVLQLAPGTDYVADPAPAGIVGTGGIFVFRYSAFAAGTQILRFDYARPRETTDPEQSALFAVAVEE